jgi:hypothetical protein
MKKALFSLIFSSLLMVTGSHFAHSASKNVDEQLGRVIDQNANAVEAPYQEVIDLLDKGANPTAPSPQNRLTALSVLMEEAIVGIDREEAKQKLIAFLNQKKVPTKDDFRKAANAAVNNPERFVDLIVVMKNRGMDQNAVDNARNAFKNNQQAWDNFQSRGKKEDINKLNGL